MFAKQEGEWNVSRVRDLNKFPTKENQTCMKEMATLIFPLWSKGMISCGFWPSKPIENLQSEQNLSETGVRRRYLDLTSRMDDGNLCLLPNQVKGFEKVKDVFNWNFRQSTFAFHPAMHVKVCETFTFRKFFVEVMFLLKSESFFVLKMKVWPIHLPPIKWCISDALFIWGGGCWASGSAKRPR